MPSIRLWIASLKAVSPSLMTSTRMDTPVHSYEPVRNRSSASVSEMLLFSPRHQTSIVLRAPNPRSLSTFSSRMLRSSSTNRRSRRVNPSGCSLWAAHPSITAFGSTPENPWYAAIDSMVSKGSAEATLREKIPVSTPSLSMINSLERGCSRSTFASTERSKLERRPRLCTSHEPNASMCSRAWLPVEKSRTLGRQFRSWIRCLDNRCSPDRSTDDQNPSHVSPESSVSSFRFR